MVGLGALFAHSTRCLKPNLPLFHIQMLQSRSSFYTGKLVLGLCDVKKKKHVSSRCSMKLCMQRNYTFKQFGRQHFTTLYISVTQQYLQYSKKIGA